MSINDTPGTSPDPETGAEGDSDQLSGADTLFDRGDYDPLDEGYSPPERARGNHWGETEWEQAHHEPLDSRLAAEEPEVWEVETAADTTRAGRLVSDFDADPDQDGNRENDVYALDEGIDGAGASAEEAAMHWIEQP
jgi:hypothetical protein